MNKLLLLLLLTAITFNATAQEKKLTRAQAVADIDSLINTISNIHPSMFAVCPEKTFFKAVKKVKKELPDSMSLLEFYKHAAPLVTMLGDGHTNINFPYDNLGKDDTARLFFPLALTIGTNDSVIRVRGDYSLSEKSLPAGAQILSINGHASKDMVNNMLRYVSGERSFFRLYRLTPVTPYMLMLYPADHYHIVYKYDGKTEEAILPASTARQAIDKEKELQNTQRPDYTFTINREKNTAIMNFNSFYDPQAFQTFADSMFRTLKNENIPNLIIDIRKNGGGNSSIGNELCQYISPVPFVQFEKMIIRTTPTTLKLKQQLYGQLSQNDSIYGIKSYDVGTLKELRENNLRYTGNVYLLISHFTFSSASSFAWTFKQFVMGTVIGEESGGMGVCFGDILYFYLPNSNLCCCISHKEFYQYGAAKEDNHGTQPHYNIPEEDALQWTLDNLIDKKVNMMN